MKRYIKYSKIIMLLIAAAFLMRCSDDDDDNRQPKVLARFSQTIEDDKGTIRFLNTSENAKTYVWDFGDGTSSNEINPIKQYSAAGTFTVTLTATNSTGQTDVFTDQLNVAVILPVTVPVTFDDNNVDYRANTFSGAAFEVVDNPDVSGSNDVASKVGAITNSGVAFEGLFWNLGTPLDLSMENAVTMNFWSDAPIHVLLKLEEGTAGSIETTASHGGSGWETIGFIYNSSAQYARLTLFVDSPGTTAGTFFIDDIEQIEGSELVVPIDPTAPSPAPTQDPSNVISIYSDAYQDVPNNGFNLYGAAAFEEVQLEGNGVLKYTTTEAGGGNFQVIELGGNQIDAAGAGMTNFRFDLWFSNEVTASSAFLLKLVDIPSSGPTEALININPGSNPAMAQGTWLQFDLPLSELQANGLGGTSNIQQVVIDLVNAGAAYIDNIYFYSDAGGNGGGGSATPIIPTEPAPAPTQDASSVISIYSDAYQDVPKDGFNLYGAAAFEEVQIAGSGSLKYTFVDGGGGNFQVIELGGNQIDATAANMTNFRFDLWFPNAVNESSAFLLKLVDIPSSGPTEAQINISPSSNPAMVQGSWIQFDLPLSELQANGLGGTSNIQQVVVDLLTAGEVYIDNIYFYNAAGGNGNNGPVIPTEPAPSPTQDASNVISIYSDAYENVPNDGFNLYGAAAFEETQIAGNGSLKYTLAEGDGGNFQVIELGGNQVDAAAAGMTNFRFDLWFPNEVGEGSTFLLKLVDIPGSGPTEAQINISPSSNPAMVQGSWLQFDIPLSELQASGLGGISNIQQVVIDLLTSGEVYVDNIYFYKEGDNSNGSGGDGSGSDTNILELTFSDTTSIDVWKRIADANSAEASIDWIVDGGVEGGAMKVVASNPSADAGKAYIFQLDTTGLNYDGATDVRLTFDLKLAAPLTAAAVHLQTNVPGVGVTDNFDLQNSGLNESDFTNYSFDFTGVEADAGTFTIHFNFASGAVEGAGGELLIDNIKLVKTN